MPASNSEVARELVVSVEAIRTHLKTLFRLFDVPDLPQNRKRRARPPRARLGRRRAPRPAEELTLPSSRGGDSTLSRIAATRATAHGPVRSCVPAKEEAMLGRILDNRKADRIHEIRVLDPRVHS